MSELPLHELQRVLIVEEKVGVEQDAVPALDCAHKLSFVMGVSERGVLSHPKPKVDIPRRLMDDLVNLRDTSNFESLHGDGTGGVGLAVDGLVLGRTGRRGEEAEDGREGERDKAVEIESFEIRGGKGGGARGYKGSGSMVLLGPL